VQHEVAKAISLPLARQADQAKSEVAQAQAHLEGQRQARSTYHNKPQRPRAQQRHQRRTLSARLLAPLRQPEHLLNRLAVQERKHLEQLAGECADLFQRSSSCVEGRNGQLALQHHGRHRLSERKLTALTAVHNDFIRRPDGTTAAERFFRRPPDPVFECLLQLLPPPPRPARKRPRAPKPSYLLPVAA
jgi:hypothetical protein